MQRDRHECIGVSDQFAACIRHPAAHDGRQVEPVAVFQGMNKRAGDIAVTNGCACSVIGGRIGNGLDRDNSGAGIIGKRDSEPLAIGRGNERELRPADRAYAFVADRLAAANPLAVEAGIEILAKGGNALDAAVAVQAMLGLVEPQSSGVGGGAFLIPDKLPGVSRVIHVEHGDCANAVGAAIAQVSGECDQIFKDMSRRDAIAAAQGIANDRAVAAGADRKTLATIESEDMPLAYLPGNSVRVRVRVVGDVAAS